MSISTKASPHELPNHHYDLLQTETSIRLLNLEIGSSDDNYGRLETFQLDKAPPFAALSYTWGNPYAEPNYELEDIAQGAFCSRKYTSERNCPIRCDETKVMVTHNLVDALDHIKRCYGPRKWPLDSRFYIWIDAICINQENIQERDAQVAIMGRIYASAKGVFVWLGCSLPKTAKALELIKYLAAIPEEKYSIMRNHDPKIFWETYQALDMEMITIDDWLIVLSFIERNWFHRVWIIQEFCLPRYTTVLCGPDVIPWVDIYLVSRMLKLTDWCHQLVRLEDWRDAYANVAIRKDLPNHENSGSTPQIITLSNSSISDPAMYRPTTSNAVPGLGPYALSMIRQLLWPDAFDQKIIHPLLLSVQAARTMRATDPRDRVYALLDGINLRLSRTPGLEPIIPSYDASNTVENVFTDITIRIILADNNLDVLSLVNDETLRKIPGLPSWALDLTMSLNPPKMVAEYVSNAPGKVKFEPPTFTGLTHLHCRGYYLDVIVNSALPYHPLDSRYVIDWLKLALELPMPYHTGEGLTEVLWRTVLANANKIDNEYPAPASCGTSFGNYLFTRIVMINDIKERGMTHQERTAWLHQGLQALANLKTIDPDGAIMAIDQFHRLYVEPLVRQKSQNPGRQMWETFYPMMENGQKFEDFMGGSNFCRRLLLTQKKYLGLGSECLRHGDEIWALPGMKAPVVLRRLSSGNFTLVGPVYIHGIMNGEGIYSETRLEAITLE
ncbi:HET domain containing protein [Hyaloscypha variabilis]